jgi:hypothetical protein
MRWFRRSGATGIEANVEKVKGPVLIGHEGVQVNVEGDLEIVAAPRVRITRRADPPDRLPRAVDTPIGRDDDVARLTEALGTTLAELVGVDAIGKTTLLAHALPRLDRVRRPVIYVSGRRWDDDGALDVVFHELYDCSHGYSPPPAVRSRFLAQAEATVVLDDADVAETTAAAFGAELPGCTVVTTTASRTLDGLGAVVEVVGLGIADGCSLLERVLGRPLAAEERPKAARLVELLAGHPLRLVRCAAIVRRGVRTFARLVRLLQADAERRAELLDPGELTADDHEVLVVLAALRGGVYVHDVGAIARVQDAAELLERLEELGLVRAHSPRFSVAEDVEYALLWLPEERGRAVEAALHHFLPWLDGAGPNELLAEADVLIALAEAAVDAEHYDAVAPIARALALPLALGGRWRAWKRVLDAEYTAAFALGPLERARHFHAAGVQSACEGAVDTAVSHLDVAIGLWQIAGHEPRRQVSSRSRAMLDFAQPAERAERAEPVVVEEQQQQLGEDA